MNCGGYELIGDWEISNRGFTAVAVKGGKKYFLKKYGDYKKPVKNASTSEKLYKKLEKNFNEFKNNRVRINEALKSIACEGGNIILPGSWFTEDNCFTEVTEFIDGALSDDEIYRLGKDKLPLVMMTITKALKDVHGKNLVHSDLKRSNILVTKNTSGNTIGKLIDFDKSYFTDDLRPDDLGGDQLYMSPELTDCLITECDERSLEKLSTKSDIFSLGLVFHNYLSKGDFPEIVNLKGKLKERKENGKMVYAGEAVLSGAELKISSKIKDKFYISLLSNMLCHDPDKRLSALEVLETLKSKKVLEVTSGEGVYTGETDFSETAESKDKKMAASKEIPSGFAEPHPEHDFSFDEPELNGYGYVSSERMDKGGIKCYRFYTSSGTSSVLTANHLKALGVIKSKEEKREKPGTDIKTESKTGTGKAVKKETDEGVWEEDSGYTILLERIVEDGYRGYEKMTKNGFNGYNLIRKDGSKVFAVLRNMRLFGYARAK